MSSARAMGAVASATKETNGHSIPETSSLLGASADAVAGFTALPTAAHIGGGIKTAIAVNHEQAFIDLKARAQQILERYPKKKTNPKKLGTFLYSLQDLKPEAQFEIVTMKIAGMTLLDMIDASKKPDLVAKLKKILDALSQSPNLTIPQTQQLIELHLARQAKGNGSSLMDAASILRTLADRNLEKVKAAAGENNSSERGDWI